MERSVVIDEKGQERIQKEVTYYVFLVRDQLKRPPGRWHLESEIGFLVPTLLHRSAFVWFFHLVLE